MARNGFAFIAGLILAVLTVATLQAIGHTVFPAPAGPPEAGDADAASYMATLPFGSQFAVALSWWCGALFGSLLAVRTGTTKPAYLSTVITSFILAGAISNLIAFPHPSWFWWAGLPGIVIAGAVATVVGEKIRPARP